MTSLPMLCLTFLRTKQNHKLYINASEQHNGNVATDKITVLTGFSYYCIWWVHWKHSRVSMITGTTSTRTLRRTCTLEKLLTLHQRAQIHHTTCRLETSIRPTDQYCQIGQKSLKLHPNDIHFDFNQTNQLPLRKWTLYCCVDIIYQHSNRNW